MRQTQNQAFFLIATFLLIGLCTTPDSAVAKKCGRGCQRTMDNACTVEARLWAAAEQAIKQGIRVTSCCRSPQYNALLRQCGYFPAKRSAHMSGQAIDLIVSPRNCNSGYLQRIGFPPVCPYYHHGHCHVQTRCGTAASAGQARAKSQKRAQKVRNYNRSGRGGDWNEQGRSRSSRRRNYATPKPWAETFWSEVAR